MAAANGATLLKTLQTSRFKVTCFDLRQKDYKNILSNFQVQQKTSDERRSVPVYMEEPLF